MRPEQNRKDQRNEEQSYIHKLYNLRVKSERRFHINYLDLHGI